MSDTSDKLTEEILKSIFANPATLAIGALLFGAGLIATNPIGYSVASFSDFLTLENVFKIFVGGLIALGGFSFISSKSPLNHAISFTFKNFKPLAIGGLLYTAGQFFVGLANSTGSSTLEGAILGIVGYALIAVSILTSTSVGAAAFAAQTPTSPSH